ncbi:hypothetical protein JCM17843_14800 [Kordiimonadales bacterium JCM 17843]|nr:hypothetical protein JCM17843_14800 [Kordiimonadales bacterium JCM 17843]
MATADEIRLIRSQLGLFPDAETPVSLDEYQQFTTKTDKNKRPGVAGLGFVLLGLFGEVGSLLSELKKKQRDRDSYVAYRDAVIEEFGDVLWYFANAALRANLSLSAIAKLVPADLANWEYHGREGASTFVDLQTTKAEFSGPRSTMRVERRLLALAGKVGQLMENFSNKKFKLNRDALSANLVEIFRALIAAADDADVSLEEAACRNIAKASAAGP